MIGVMFTLEQYRRDVRCAIKIVISLKFVIHMCKFFRYPQAYKMNSLTAFDLRIFFQTLILFKMVR